MSQRRKFKLLVNDHGQNSIRVLQYVKQNLKIINEMGVYIVVVKIREEDKDRDLVDKLIEQGIERLPALITNEGRVHVGLKKIQELFDNNMDKFAKFKMTAVTPRGARVMDETETPIGSGADLTDFYRKTLEMGDERTEDNDKNDIERKMRMRQASTPKHYQTPRSAMDDGGTGRHRGSRIPQMQDNFGAPPKITGDVKDMTAYVGVGEKEDYGTQDEMMERAYWGNQPTGITYD